MGISTAFEDLLRGLTNENYVKSVFDGRKDTVEITRNEALQIFISKSYSTARIMYD